MCVCGCACMCTYVPYSLCTRSWKTSSIFIVHSTGAQGNDNDDDDDCARFVTGDKHKNISELNNERRGQHKILYYIFCVHAFRKWASIQASIRPGIRRWASGKHCVHVVLGLSERGEQWSRSIPGNMYYWEKRTNSTIASLLAALFSNGLITGFLGSSSRSPCPVGSIPWDYWYCLSLEIDLLGPCWCEIPTGHEHL